MTAHKSSPLTFACSVLPLPARCPPVALPASGSSSRAPRTLRALRARDRDSQSAHNALCAQHHLIRQRIPAHAPAAVFTCSPHEEYAHWDRCWTEVRIKLLRRGRRWWRRRAVGRKLLLDGERLGALYAFDSHALGA
eukprot:3550810-Prymnesium_polylepis.1